MVTEYTAKALRVIKENPGAFPQYDFKSIYSNPQTLKMAEVLIPKLPNRIRNAHFESKEARVSWH